MAMEFHIPDVTRSIIPGTKDYVSVMVTQEAKIYWYCVT
jgi:hypothetical protein